MSAQIDVLAVLRANMGPHSKAVVAVAELVEADRDYDAAYATIWKMRDGVSTIGEVVRAEVALRRAQSRRATALARCGVAK